MTSFKKTAKNCWLSMQDHPSPLKHRSIINSTHSFIYSIICARCLPKFGRRHSTLQMAARHRRIPRLEHRTSSQFVSWKNKVTLIYVLLPEAYLDYLQPQFSCHCLSNILFIYLFYSFVVHSTNAVVQY